ncbi:hypothetical protein BUALT_Bualt18G0050400 [Buddleja alternifolia]|uniref:Protein kinase domain-containing protein n=1 Tax=Buddleja alternifolia TaxID=168488 RepID=A0AAV6WD50_9LAMI|nr:hypothetical protein BUALT_Bualt18G0050400 [Buddleja alternifolia]
MCLCVSFDSCKYTIVMDGSSESGWQRSDSSRGLNSSSFSDRNPRILRGRERKGRDGTLWPDIDSHRTPVAGAEDAAVEGGTLTRPVESNDVSLRQWLDNPERRVDAFECCHIFSQIVHIVDLAHSQGIVVHNVRPSCFVMSSYNRVSFIESASCSDSGTGSGSDSPEYGSKSQAAEFKGSGSKLNSGTSCLQSCSGNQAIDRIGDKKHSFPMKQILLMESNWYTSPEEVSGGSSVCASDIYQLGVLLFELFCTFGSVEEKSTTMASLRHRVLPPQLLLKWPKEASFCLWLLHPEPSSRPKMRRVSVITCPLRLKLQLT